jgi:hypothetical protein
MRGRVLLALSCTISGGLLGCGASGWTDVPALAQPPAPVRPAHDAGVGAPETGSDPDELPADAAVEPGPRPGPTDASAAADLPPADTRLDSGPAEPPDTAPPAPPSACLPHPAPDELISTFEDGSFTVNAAAGRDATAWYLINNDMGASAILEVVEGPQRCESHRFLRFAGMNSPTKSPIARVLFRASSAADPFYDARAQGYVGLRLAMRAGATSRVRIKLPDRNTASSGGICVACSDHFGKDLDVPATWTTFSIPFAELTQTGLGDRQPAVNAAALFGIELVVRLAVFELDVDDVSFYR